LAREVAAVLVALSTLPKQKWKRKRQTSMYFKARRSTRIKVGRPQPQSKGQLSLRTQQINQKKSLLQRYLSLMNKEAQKPPPGER